MSEILSKHERCTVIRGDGQIYKVFKSQKSFNNEKTVYERLKGKDYIPNFEIVAGEPIIIIDQIKLLNLDDFIKTNNYIPDYLIDSLYKIRLEMLDKNLFDYGDFFKYEHIFIDENFEYSKEYGIVVIDFDQCYDISAGNKKNEKNILNKDFDFIKEHPDNFNSMFRICVPPNILDDFYSKNIYK